MTFNDDDDDAMSAVAATPEYTAPKTFLNGFGSHISTIVKNINNCLYNWWYISYYHFCLVTTTFVTDYDGWPRLDHQKLSDCIKIISEWCTLLLLFGTKVIFSEIRVRTWVQVVSRQKTGFWLADLSGLSIGGMFFGGKLLELMSWLWCPEKLTLVM